MDKVLPNDLARLKPNEIVAIAEDYGKKFAENVKTHQIRIVFSHINRMRLNFKNQKDFKNVERDVFLLKPKLAYAAGRKKDELQEFNSFMQMAIDAVISSSKPEEAFQNFLELVEAVVAYHKFYGGRDN